MREVSFDDLDPSAVRESRRSLSTALDTTDVAISHYTVPPGEAFSGSLHTHYDQEEVFIVLEGTATFQVEAGTIEVPAGEAVRFDRGDFQRGYNGGDVPVVAIVLGAPGAHHDLSQSKALIDCERCGERTLHDIDRPDDATEYVRSCQECGTVNDPGPPPGLVD